MQTEFKKGDAIPAYWFGRTDHIKRMEFGCDVTVTVEDGNRYVRATGGASAGALLILYPVEPGPVMTLDPTMPLVLYPAAGDTVAILKAVK